MLQTLEWYDEAKTIAVIRQHVGGSWSYWYEILDVMMEAIDNAEDPLSFILMDTTKIPSGNPIPHFKRTIEVIEPKEDRIAAIVIVGNSSIGALVDAFLGIVLKVAGRKTTSARFASSLEDALKIIEEMKR